MTRGRIPVRARKEADPIAERRGVVQHYQREPGSICDFSIMSPGIVSHVRIKCVRRFCCTVEEMGRELATEIAALRIIASSREISRELWLCSPRYAWRFFRVLDQSLTELGRDGMPLPTTGHGAGIPIAGPSPVGRPGSTPVS
jgi:hypothetical protein